jgi:hypothetical protein
MLHARSSSSSAASHTRAITDAQWGIIAPTLQEHMDAPALRAALEIGVAEMRRRERGLSHKELKAERRKQSDVAKGLRFTLAKAKKAGPGIVPIGVLEGMRDAEARVRDWLKLNKVPTPEAVLFAHAVHAWAAHGGSFKALRPEGDPDGPAIRFVRAVAKAILDRDIDPETARYHVDKHLHRIKPAGGLETESPVLDSPALGQIHCLHAADLVVGSPSIGAPTLKIA